MPFNLPHTLPRQVVAPQIERRLKDKSLRDVDEVMEFLRSGTLVGLLPVPHPIMIRKYQPVRGRP